MGDAETASRIGNLASDPTTTKGFRPVVVNSAWKPSAETIRIAQRLGDEGLERHTDQDDETADTYLPGLYACRRAVERHQDLEGAKPGMHVYGLVIRSDGHRLHSDRLDAAGCPEGLPLKAGDFYDLDPYDPHWTTIPAGVAAADLIFYVEGEMPDDRSLGEVAETMAMFLEEDLLTTEWRQM